MKRFLRTNERFAVHFSAFTALAEDGNSLQWLWLISYREIASVSGFHRCFDEFRSYTRRDKFAAVYRRLRKYLLAR